MEDDSNEKDGLFAKNSGAEIDIDALLEGAASAESAIRAAGGLQALSEQMSAAQDAIDAVGGMATIATQAELARRHIDEAISGGRPATFAADLASLGLLSTPSKIFESLEHRHGLAYGGMSDSLTRAAMGIPPESLMTVAQSLAGMSRTTEMARISELTRSLSLASIDLPRFEIPDVSAISELSRQLEALVRPSFDIPALRISDMLSGLHSPWLDTSNALPSAEALVRMQGLGLQLTTSTAFNPDFTALLRESLGDWRDVTAIPESLLEQPARSDFYLDLGFDARIVDRPDEAFDEALTLAGIAFAPEDNSVEGRHDDAGLARSRQVQEVLQRLEAELRSFIMAVLTAEFGPQWYKQLPNNLYDDWAGKQTQDPRGSALEPIDYADFRDFERIICKRDLFERVFARYFVTIESARESLVRLVAPRNTAMHSRPIGKDDALFVAFEVRRLRLQVKRSR